MHPCRSGRTFHSRSGRHEQSVTTVDHLVRGLIEMHHLHLFIEQDHAKTAAASRFAQGPYPVKVGLMEVAKHGERVAGKSLDPAKTIPAQTNAIPWFLAINKPTL